ncbi:MAG: TlpA disulfide reductase family protein [Dysgonamonadaceae bacterium]
MKIRVGKISILVFCFVLTNLFGINASEIQNNFYIFVPDNNGTVGTELPTFQLTTPQGKKIKSDELKGKVLLLDFWASWCAPCKKMTGEIDELLNTYHDKSNFLMVGINYREYNKSGALKYWEEHGYKFPMASDNDVLGKSIQAGNPTILVIDKTGIIRGRWDAYTPETAAAVKKIIDSLL